MRGYIKRFFAFSVCIILCMYAAWKQMQFLVIVSLVLSLMILFKSQTKRIVEIVYDLLSSTRHARLGKLEFQVDNQTEDLSRRIVRQAGWVQILLSQLASDEVGLLLAMSKTERFPAPEALKEKLRALRTRGLIQHNKSTMADSGEVWLTELGKDFTRILIEAEAAADNPQNNQILAG